MGQSTTLTGPDNSIVQALVSALSHEFGQYQVMPTAPDGLANRYDVFANWGTDVSGFSPGSLVIQSQSGSEPIMAQMPTGWTEYDVQYTLMNA